MAPPTGVVPPELPPSVEEAYRAKCIQLKQRLNEIEDSNDLARQRMSRLNRAIQKSRLERAFLLEQLAKRTSTNVEDSEGSPSPPPTPKEKPLRTKRGHRKPDFLITEVSEGRTNNSTFIQQGQATVSPSSDAFSHTHPDPLHNSTPQTQTHSSKRQLPTNGTQAGAEPKNLGFTTPQSRRPKNAFELYCSETRTLVAIEHKKEIADGSYDLEAALAKGWSSLEGEKKEEYTQRIVQMKRAAEVRKDAAQEVFDESKTIMLDGADEDIEMGDDAPTSAPAAEIGGFTPVNRS